MINLNFSDIDQINEKVHYLPQRKSDIESSDKNHLHFSNIGTCRFTIFVELRQMMMPQEKD